MDAVSASYRGCRHPAEIISHCVWPYRRYPLSFREVEKPMPAHRVVVPYETVRQLCAMFEPAYAHELRPHKPQAEDKRHFDEVFVRITGEWHHLWRTAHRTQLPHQTTDRFTICNQATDLPTAASPPHRHLHQPCPHTPPPSPPTDKLTTAL